MSWSLIGVKRLSDLERKHGYLFSDIGSLRFGKELSGKYDW